MRYSVLRTALLYAALTGLYILVLDLSLDLLTAGVSRHPAARLVLVVATMSLSFFFLSRELQVRWHAEQSLRQAHDELQARVHERTAGLAQINEALRQSEETARGLLNAITDATFLIDATGVFLALNEATAKRIGKSADELLGSCIYDFLAPQVAQARKAQVDEAIRTRKPVRYEDDRSGRLIDNSLYPILDAQGRVARIAIYGRDITVQRQTEKLLMQHAVEMEELYKTSLEVNSQFDVPLLLQAIVQRATELIGAPVGGLYLLDPDGRTLELFVGHNMPPNRIGVALRLGEGLAGRVAQSASPLMVEDYKNWEGRVAAFADSPYHRILGVPLMVRDKVIGVINVTDETIGPFDENHVRLLNLFAAQAAIAIENARLYQAAQETALRLQTTSSRLLQAQETERRSIARELHDEIGQTLTAVKINLQAVRRASAPSAQTSILDESIAVIEHALHKVRDLSLDLHPSLLDDLGLVPALRWYMHRQAERAGFSVTVVADSLEAHLPSDLEIVCFRVVQEALTNVARHARARHVLVELRQRDSQLELVVRDDGVGFDVPSALERAARGASLGLRGMEERVTLVGGQVEIESVLTHGTEIRARFPLASPSPEAQVPPG